MSEPVIIDLSLDNGSGPRTRDQLVHRASYDTLRERVISHLDGLESATDDYAAGAGWTFFLDGTRGAGKSTFLSSVKQGLQEDQALQGKLNFVSIIDPSRIEGSEIILLVILQKLKKSVEERLQNCRRREDEYLNQDWKRAFRAVAGGLSLLSDRDPLKDLDPDLFLDWGLEQASDSTSLRNRLYELFSVGCRILGVRALMFAFDDADTDSRHAIKILECIRKYLDIPMVMVIVTGDLELYSLLVKQHFSATVTGRRDFVLETGKRDRPKQYDQMINHLEEQYLLKLFPIKNRIRLLPIEALLLKEDIKVRASSKNDNIYGIKYFSERIIRIGLCVKSPQDIDLYVRFILHQPIRSVIQVLSQVAPFLYVKKYEKNGRVTDALARSLLELSLTSLYKNSIDTDALSTESGPSLVQAVFDLALLDGDIDTAAYLRPSSADQDIRRCFVALASGVTRLCKNNPSNALKYIFRVAGSITLYSQAYSKDLNSVTNAAHKFVGYIGIGRDEDCLDWGRRATALIAAPYTKNSQKTRVVLPGIIGLNRKGRPGKLAASTAVLHAAHSGGSHSLMMFGFTMVNVSSGFGMRTYASIFVLLGLIEKMLTARDGFNAFEVCMRSYPPVTISAPDWSSPNEVDNTTSLEEEVDFLHYSIHMFSEIQELIINWKQSSTDLYENINPSSIFLGKVWSRLFRSLENAADELRRKPSAFSTMEIFVCCIINAFLIEEYEHHLPSKEGMWWEMNRSNPRTSVDTLIHKISVANITRNDFPMTSIIATCPLIVGLLKRDNIFADGLSKFFPKSTSSNYILNIMCSEESIEEMNYISIAGGS
ncbi:hypothetical protein [Komagataeibacter swingsii]|uniref:KAP NTPase domain-containing protein n=1 Tax=Komagataeibacter swingsii TaxID=215220 RepID=A0A850P759_9PROT|nr:hypothetical protein [Komagataeibacter swingsii]NVN38420.1 hypothetical protein [Komagataeibacter swingsii]